MIIAGFGEFIDTTDGQKSLFARVRLASGHEFDFPLLPEQLDILRAQLSADGKESRPKVATPPPNPAFAPMANPNAGIPVPKVRPTGDNPWGDNDDDEEPEGFQLAFSTEAEE